jgi:hypothetical protein
VALGAICVVFSVGCSDVRSRQGEQSSDPYLTSDSRHPIPHLETIQGIVSALVEEDYGLAKGLTETHLEFFMHRQAMASQQPENFPPAYHDLAMAHHQAAEDLARIIPTKDLKQIMPKLDGVLKACVACHLKFKLEDRS